MEASARATLETVERLAEPPSVARADRLPAYRLLAALGNLPDDRIQATALLEPLLEGRQAAARERLATLRAVLDHGAAGEAATVLGIHRNTLAYRIRGIETLTGWDESSAFGQQIDDVVHLFDATSRAPRNLAELEDCVTAPCSVCGACDYDVVKNRVYEAKDYVPEPPRPPRPPDPIQRTRVRVR